MFSALAKGIRQLNDPATRQLVWLSIGITAVTFVILFTFVEMALRYTSIFQTGWMEAVADILGRLAGGVLTWLLFPAAISAVVGLFLERAVRAVEARHYPALQETEERSSVESLLTAIKFLVTLVALNLALFFFIFSQPCSVSCSLAFFPLNFFFSGSECPSLYSRARFVYATFRVLVTTPL